MANRLTAKTVTHHEVLMSAKLICCLKTDLSPVIARHGRSKNGVASLAYDRAIQ